MCVSYFQCFSEIKSWKFTTFLQLYWTLHNASVELLVCGTSSPINFWCSSFWKCELSKKRESYTVTWNSFASHCKPFYLVRRQKNVHLTWKEVSRGDMVAPYGGLMRWLQSRTTKQTWNFLSVNYKLRKTPRRDQCDLNVCLFLFRNWVLFKISRQDPHDNWVSLSSGRSCQCPSGAYACDHLLSMPCPIWHHKTKHRNKALEIVGVSKVGEF